LSLVAFWIDQTEVTNAQYAHCVNAGKCTRPINTDHFNNSDYTNHPVVYVNWDQAKAYCLWAGRELPTEAQWEKAARGTGAFTYPWGEGIDCSRANYLGCKNDTTPAGSHESGKSPYGAYDMAGTVWEWVNDWYSETYYQNSPAENPPGPDSGTTRVLRGGSWLSGGSGVRSAGRSGVMPYFAYSDVGFRCARSLP
jgi:formylglycine-generating enzyme required for sulfatase activity